ncbi:MAG: MFS transporter, partial [Actinomycetota bacterium]|nr:MFS transporter [Actinomycetota bacterium]
TGSSVVTRSDARSLFRDPTFRMHYLGSVGLTAAMFVPFVHLPGYATSYGHGPASGACLVALSGVVSLVTRPAVAPVVARRGSWRISLSAAALLAASVALLPLGGGDRVLLTAFAVIFGAAHGAYVGLSPAVAAELYGVDGLGLRLGLLHTAAAVGGLAGPSAAGLAVDMTGAPGAGMAVAAALGLLGCSALAILHRRRLPPGRPAGSLVPCR